MEAYTVMKNIMEFYAKKIQNKNYKPIAIKKQLF